MDIGIAFAHALTLGFAESVVPVEAVENLVTYGGGKGRADRKNDGKRAWNDVAWRRVVTDCALAICLLYVVGSGLVRVSSIYMRETSDIQHISGGLTTVRYENKGLRSGIKFMDTPKGRERAARWSGLVKKGERRLIIPED